MTRAQKIVLWIILGIVLFGFIVYGLYQFRNVLTGPVVEIHSPISGQSFSDDFIVIEGRAKNITYIEVDGMETTVDKEGYFSVPKTLYPGYNAIKIQASDRFGKEEEVLLELFSKAQY